MKSNKVKINRIPTAIMSNSSLLSFVSKNFFILSLSRIISPYLNISYSSAKNTSISTPSTVENVIMWIIWQKTSNVIPSSIMFGITSTLNRNIIIHMGSEKNMRNAKIICIVSSDIITSLYSLIIMLKFIWIINKSDKVSCLH